jgi:hypothetical protein
MRAAVLTVVFLALATAGSAATSGLRGVVMRGPTRPVCIAERPCSAPAVGVRLTFRHAGVARTVTTDAHGRYSIGLAPGTQSVAIAGAQFGYAPRTVLVPAGRVAVRNFSIDTGIR